MKISFSSVTTRFSILIRCVFIAVLTISTSFLNAQLEWARVGIVCPCNLESDGGAIATVRFGLRNFEDFPTENLYATIAVTGYFHDEEFKEEKSLFLGTTPLKLYLDEFEEVATNTYEVELGKLPAGTVYLELIVHEGSRLNFSSLLDSVWFEGETELPFTSLSKRNMDFLTDSDGDGVDDVNETFMGTDPNDPSDMPARPEIDVLIAYDSNVQTVYPGSEPTLLFSHIFAVTNFLFERSGSPLHFRAVGTLDDSDVPEIHESFFLPDEKRDQLQDQYGADVVLVYQPGDFGLCGIVEDIGGWRGRGFIHPQDRAVLTNVWLNPSICPINVTAHEIGHLMGLGHSYVQGAVGAYYWSRGHGEHGEFGTIMSYADYDYNGIDIDKFSNPLEDCHGKPCGISHLLPNHEKSADSVLSVNITKYQFASTGVPPSDLDVDGDGYAADVDKFPLDEKEWNDTDGDGYGDNGDAFPNLASEWSDGDGDGVGDNTDPDIDGDGVLNTEDAYPFDSDVSTVRITYVVSDQLDDQFGMEIVRTDDWDGDGIDDIAIAAPKTVNENGDSVGTVYLLSTADLAQDPADANSFGSERKLNQIALRDRSWVIQGTEVDGNLGMYMTYLSATEDSEVSGILVVSSGQSVYSIPLNSTSLESFDSIDGTEDRRISLEYCERSQTCKFVGHNPGFSLRGIAAMHDRDGDGLSDFAVLGVRQENNEISLYLLTTGAVQQFKPDTTEESHALDKIVMDCDACFRIKADDQGNNITLASLGDVTGSAGYELGIAVEGTWWEDNSVVYILDTALVSLLASAGDESAAGDIPISDFIRSDLNSYTISMPGVDAFGRSIDSVADMDDDDRPDVLVWSEDGPHVLLTRTGLENLDGQDGTTDASIVLTDSSSSTAGAWYLNGISSGDHRSQKVLNSPTADIGSYILAQRQKSALLVALDDLDDFDDPIAGQRDGQIQISSGTGPPRVTRFAVPQGLRSGTSLTGMVPLGDLDGDGILDFMFAAHTRSTDRRTTSTLHVLFSSSFTAIDRADGEEDGQIYLHNNLDDTDGDGIANFYDLDDDNDGAVDLYDAYPLHVNAIYDADGDGTANVIDVFPNDPYEDSDLDGDGIGDRIDRDADGDGIVDSLDEFPLDSDNDGLNNYEDLDDDNDGVQDLLDAFPVDPTEQFDTDGDGVGDKLDLFADDATEWEDFDKDGIGNNGDADDDNDGYEDVDDRFPFNPEEWADADGDGIGDNADQFPNNPFEWEDADDDGLGDNLGNVGIATYRIESEWTKLDRYSNQVDPSTHYLGDYNSAGGLKLLIEGGSPQDPRGALHLLSSTDLGQLDSSDQQLNQTIQVGDIAQGIQSWELRGPYASLGSLYLNAGAMIDIDRDGIGDFVIGAPVDELGNGVIYIVRGSQLANADIIDGTADGKINHTQCSVDGMCIDIRNSTDDRFGSSVTSLNGLFGEGKSVVVATNYFSSARTETDEDMEGIPMVYLLSDTAILGELSAGHETPIQLNQLIESEETLQIFPEEEVLPYGPNAYQLADYDNDGAEDLLIDLRFDSKIYFLASSDILESYSDDGAEDGRINLVNILNKPNSYRLDGFTVDLPSARTTRLGRMYESPQFLSVSPGFSASGQHYLVDVTELATHDESDGTVDGIVTKIELSDTNTWQIKGVSRLELCNGGIDLAETYVVGDATSFSDSKFYLSTLGAMRNLVESAGATSNTVDFPDAVSNGAAEIWTIGLGSLADNSSSSKVSCAGDWDNDGSEDLTVSILQTRFDSSDPFETTVKATVILLMTSDLPALDSLDGTMDKQVDISRLWRTVSDD